MNRNIVYGLVALVVIAGGSYLFLQNDGGSNEGEVKIGVIAGTTGEYAFVGENYLKGVRLALADWNTANPNNQVEIVVEDDGFDAGKGLAAYRKLMTFDKVDAISNMTSVTIDAIYDDVLKQGIPLVQFGEQGIEPKDDNVLQILEGNMETQIALGAFTREQGYKNIAVFVSNNATFERFYNGFKSGYGAEHQVYRVNPGDQSLSTQVLKAMSLKPDAVVVLTVPADGAIIAREVNTSAPDLVALLFDASAFSGWAEYQKILGDTNVLNGDSVVVLKQSDVAPSFTSAYTAMFAEEPGVGATWGYDSFTFLLTTMGNDKNNREQWVLNMKTKSVAGVGGSIKFDAAGVRIPAFFIGTVTGGALPTK